MNINNIITILEARSHSYTVDKMDTLQYIKNKYKNDSNIYVHFGDVDKIGINPSTKYRTPNGFYCYPLKFLLSNPYISNRPYPEFKSKFCMIVKLINQSGIYDMMDSVPSDIIKIIKQQRILHKIDQNLTFKMLWEALYRKAFRKYGKWDTYETKPNEGPREEAIYILSLLRKLNINGLTDLTGTGTIHKNERFQAVFFNMANIKHLETIRYEKNILFGNQLINNIYNCKSIQQIRDICIPQYDEFVSTMPYEETDDEDYTMNSYTEMRNEFYKIQYHLIRKITLLATSFNEVLTMIDYISKFINIHQEIDWDNSSEKIAEMFIKNYGSEAILSCKPQSSLSKYLINRARRML